MAASESFSLVRWFSSWWNNFTDWRNWKIWTILRLKQQESPLAPPFSTSLVQTEGVKTRHRRLSKAIQTVAAEANIPAAEQLSFNELLGDLVAKTAEKQQHGSTSPLHFLDQKQKKDQRGLLLASKSVEKPRRGLWITIFSLLRGKATSGKRSFEKRSEQTLHVS